MNGLKLSQLETPIAKANRSSCGHRQLFTRAFVPDRQTCVCACVCPVFCSTVNPGRLSWKDSFPFFFPRKEEEFSKLKSRMKTREVTMCDYILVVYDFFFFSDLIT